VRSRRYAEPLPFDSVDADAELPSHLRRSYPGLTDRYTYAHVFERICVAELGRVLDDLDSADEGRQALRNQLTLRLINLSLYDDQRLSAEAFSMLRRLHCHRDELRASLTKLRLVVNQAPRDVNLRSRHGVGVTTGSAAGGRGDARAADRGARHLQQRDRHRRHRAAAGERAL